MIVAIVGAESTGKTLLAERLAARIRDETGLDCVAVPEWLRAWCEHEGRTPRADEQAEIAQTQCRWLLEAAEHHTVVVADTTPLMTAIYSDLLFGDVSLYPSALAFHRDHCAVTLLTALDVEWTADGLQRDGPQVREPVDGLLRAAFDRSGLAWSSIAGLGPLRLDAAVAAIGVRLSAMHLPNESILPRIHAEDSTPASPNIRCTRCG